ncbi:MAG: DUF3426 domain-containing protein [Psychrobacter sp.]|nr:DUF3426 domain-containing protein [Psychrobacter sp.]
MTSQSESLSSKTQCPDCGTQFVLPPKALNNVSAKARCKNCQHIFLVNDHLVTDDVMTNRESTELSTVKPAVSKSHPVNPKASGSVASQSVAADDLIHDNMPLDEDDDLGSIDEELDNWLNNSSMTTQLSTPAAAHRFDKEVNNESSVHADNTDAQDDWLNKLLDEEGPGKDPNLSRSETNDNSEDLSKLLADFGVESVAPTTVSREEVLAKMNARLQTTQSQSARHSGKSPLSNVVWGLGCLLLALLLAAQYIIFNVDELMKNPNHAAKLQSICHVAKCALPGADLQQISVAHLKHRSSQVEAGTSHSDIMAALVNNSSDEQLFPNVKVSVYGSTGLIGEFAASPAQYLTPPQRLLIGNQSKLIMFTVPIADSNIQRIDVNTFY